VRRIVNIWPKIFQLQTVNYWVVTVPLNLRPLFGKEGLNAFRRYLIRKVKREFPGCKGFSRFHWAGDKRPDLYAPHLNILFSGPGWIEPETLQRYRREISAWMKTTFKLNHYPAANIYTSYTSNTEKKKHLVNYITRATFFGNAGAIQSIIKGFRNTAPFGKWDKAEEQSTDETTLAMRNIDATDGTPIVWETQKTEKQIQKIDRETGESITITKISKKVILRPQKNFKSLVIDAGAEHIGAGIFRIPIKPPE
jgi:hypothetical protein